MPTFDTSCWEWAGARTTAGYGRVTIDGVDGYVHRFVMDAPAGMVVDHLCRNPSCYNPRHLEVVTDYENRKRGRSKAAVAMRTNCCCNGHEFTEENTYIKPNGMRNCKTCRRLAVRAYTRRKREEHLAHV